MKKPNKPYAEMTAEQLRQATQEFDREFVADTFRPLSAAGSARHARAARRGRPQTGQGHQRINISIERGLLKQADELAKRQNIGRSALISRVLRQAVVA